MIKAILIILVGLLLSSYNYSQQKTFGYRISGNGEIISSVFLIQDGFVLDSAISNNISYRFEYNEERKLSRDINLITYPIQVYVDGRYRVENLPGYRDYYYNEKGAIDSIVVRYWNASLEVWMDNISYSVNYSYDEDGKLLSKNYSNNTSIDEYRYDSVGNLIAINTINGIDTMSSVREYDSQNRLILTKEMINGIDIGHQYIYQYDSTGNVNCLFRTIYIDRISNKYNYFLKSDESGKVTYEIASSNFLADSTWGDNYEIIFNYDENGRILEMGSFTWFHYNADGNLDSMVNTHLTLSGFLANKGTLVDSYGNNIALPSYYGDNHFYYSQLITGIKRDKLNDKTFTLPQNYPNPFNPTTIITYSLPKRSFVILKIYDLLGREITTLVNEEKQSGTYKVTWNAQNIQSGVYFYKITAGKYSKTNKMILLK